MTRKTRIKIGIVIIITCVMSFSDWSFAIIEGDKNVFGSLAWVLDFIVSALSWLWVVFANMAGEFLTNKRVYGEVLGIDSLLWKYRNIVKNLANFCLGFYLVYVIFKGLIGQFGEKGDIMKNLKNVLLWVLVAGVGVQASRFLTSVFVDLSTITLTAVGAFPYQLISQDEIIKNGMENSMRDFFKDGTGVIQNGKVFELFSTSTATNTFIKLADGKPLDKAMTEEEFLEALLPNENDVSGPLYFMGFAILRTQTINSVAEYSKSSVRGSILNLIVQGGTTIVYAIEMGVLCIIALIRILYLWMFIVLSPFAVLLSCMQKAGENDLVKDGFVGKLMKQINLKTFIAKVFQPAIVVLGISLCTIFVSLMGRIVNENSTRSMENFDMGGAKVTTFKDTTTNTSDDEKYITEYDSSLLKLSIFSIGKGILEIIMCIITVVLVYLIINMAIKLTSSGDDFVSKSIGSVQEGVTRIMKSIPIVPVAGYDKEGVPKTQYISAGKVFGTGRNSLIGGTIDKYQQKVNYEYNKQDQMINSWFDNDNNTGFLSQKDITKIRNIMDNVSNAPDKLGVLKEVKAEIGEIWDRDKNLKGMTLNKSTASNGGFWITEFTKWLNNTKQIDVKGTDWEYIVRDWHELDHDETKRDLETLFNKSSNGNYYAQTYAKFFGYTSGNYNDFDSIMNLDISKK